MNNDGRRLALSKKSLLSFKVHPGTGGLIRNPTATDVLNGRGGRVNAHCGNVFFRTIIKRYRNEYLSNETTRYGKHLIAAKIVSILRNLSPPGRFLQQDVTSGLWLEIGDEKARKKVGQALREGAKGHKRKVYNQKQKQRRKTKEGLFNLITLQKRHFNHETSSTSYSPIGQSLSLMSPFVQKSLKHISTKKLASPQDSNLSNQAFNVQQEITSKHEPHLYSNTYHISNISAFSPQGQHQKQCSTRHSSTTMNLPFKSNECEAQYDSCNESVTFINAQSSIYGSMYHRSQLKTDFTPSQTNVTHDLSHTTSKTQLEIPKINQIVVRQNPRKSTSKRQLQKNLQNESVGNKLDSIQQDFKCSDLVPREDEDMYSFDSEILMKFAKSCLKSFELSQSNANDVQYYVKRNEKEGRSDTYIDYIISGSHMEEEIDELDWWYLSEAMSK